MADVTERMLALLSTLQSGRSFGGAELTQRLGVSARTLRRDVDRLRGYGYPVQTQPGPGGFYRLVAGQAMPPLVLDDDEAVATILGLASLAAGVAATSSSGAPASAEASDAAGDTSLEHAATRAFGKLDQLLPTRLRSRVSAIRSTLETSPQSAPSVTASRIAALAEATSAQEVVTFDYVNARGEPSARRVEPHRQVHHLMRWYLLGWDLGREDWRVFRLDRISDVVRTGARFMPRSLPGDSALDYLREGFAGTGHRVRLRVHAPVTRVLDALKHEDAEITAVDAVTTDVSFHVDAWQWMLRPLTLLDADFELDAEPEMLDGLGRFAERLLGATGV